MKRLLVVICLAASVALAAPQPARKATCLIFVLKDCPIANQYAPELKRIIGKYQPKGIEFEMVFEDEDASLDECRKHSAAYGLNLPARLDLKHATARKYGISVSPSVVVIGRSVAYAGRIDDLYPSISVRRKVATKHDLTDALDAFLSGKRLKNSNTESLAVGCKLY